MTRPRGAASERGGRANNAPVSERQQLALLARMDIVNEQGKD